MESRRCSTRFLENVKQLTDANVLKMKNGDSQTAFRIAAELGFFEILGFLIEQDSRRIDQRDKPRNSPLHLAIVAKQKKGMRPGAAGRAYERCSQK